MSTPVKPTYNCIKLSGTAVKVCKLRHRILEKKKQLIDSLMAKYDSVPVTLSKIQEARVLLRKITSIPPQLRPHHISPKLIAKSYEYMRLQIRYDIACITELLHKQNGELRGERLPKVLSEEVTKLQQQYHMYGCHQQLLMSAYARRPYHLVWDGDCECFKFIHLRSQQKLPGEMQKCCSFNELLH